MSCCVAICPSHYSSGVLSALWKGTSLVEPQKSLAGDTNMNLSFQSGKQVTTFACLNEIRFIGHDDYAAGLKVARLLASYISFPRAMSS